MTFPKGESGNSKGQIRAKPVRDALYALLSREADDQLSDQPKTKAQKIALSLMQDAESADYKIRSEARSELIDRTDGKAIQAIEATGKDGEALIPPTVHVYRSLNPHLSCFAIERPWHPGSSRYFGPRSGDDSACNCGQRRAIGHLD